MTKAQCRRQLSGIRAEIVGRGEKDRQIFLNLQQLLAGETALLSYVGVRDEAPTLALLKWWLGLNRALYLPRCAGGVMEFFQITALEELCPAAFGLLEPGPHCPPAGSVGGLPCLVPGLGFTPSGQRIGYGKGYFDRFLRESGVKSIGVCYNEQMREFLPVDTWDQKVRMLVTERFIQEALDVQ